MELDLSKLNKLTTYDFIEEKRGKQPSQPSKLAVEPFKEGKAYKYTSKNSNAIESDITPLGGNRLLQLQANRKKQEIERKNAEKQLKEGNYLKSSTLQAEIIKGVLAGEDIYTLFLKAIDTIELLTNTTAFSNQVKEDIKAIYGRGLNIVEPLQVEMKEAERRLIALNRALSKEEEGNIKKRIKRAIEAHKSLIDDLQRRIDTNNN